MFKTIKSISKRTLAFILSMLMLLSSGIVGTLAANVELAETGANLTSDGTARLYFKMGAVSWWTAGTNGNGNFAYFMDSNKSGSAWSAHAVQYGTSNDFYVVIPAGTWSYVILTRNNTSTAPSWDNKWNQTGDITLSSTSNYISKFSENLTSATWGTAIKPVSTASLTASSSTVEAGTNVTLTPKLTSNADINTISDTTYSVSPTTGVSVSGNTFTATTAGTYEVTATVTYYPNGYSSITSTATASTTITVTDSNYSFTAVANPPAGGTVSPTGGAVNKESSVTLTAEAKDGYTFTGWSSPTGTFSSTNSLKTDFTPTANNAVATANFKLNEYTVTFKQSVEGDETKKGTTKINNISVTDKIYTAEFDSGTEVPMEFYGPRDYYVKSLKINNDEVSDDTSKYLTPYWWVKYNQKIEGDTTVEVVYAISPTMKVVSTDTTLNPKSATVGNVDVNNKEAYVAFKGELDIVIEAPVGYFIEKVEGDYVNTFNNTNQSVVKYSGYKTKPILTNSVINVTFKKQDLFNVTFENKNSEAGAVSYDNLNSLKYGDTVTFNVTAENSGYSFDYWLVDGKKDTEKTYTLTVTGNHKVEAHWVKQEWQGGIFVEDRKGVSNIKLYTWDSNNGNINYNGAWPGTPMIYVTTNGNNKIYYLPIEATAEQASHMKFIINGDSFKTDDLTIDPTKNYYILKSDKSVEPTYNTEYTGKTKVILDYGAKGHSNTTELGVSAFVASDYIKVDSTVKKGNVSRYVQGYADVDTLIEFTTTTIDSNFKVEGWVINGRTFVKCNNAEDNNVYRGFFQLGSESSYNIVPIYFHTDEYIKKNNISLTTLYAYTDIDTPVDNWNNYMSAYVWKTAGESGGQGQFGFWPGQLMIPMSSVGNGFYTYIETFKDKGTDDQKRLLAGVTFTNYGGTNPIVESANIQTYDYDEFIEFTNKNYNKISCVIRPRIGDDYTYNYSIATNKTENQTYNNLENVFDFEYFTDQSGTKKLDIFRKETDSTEVGLYIVRCAPVKVSGDYSAEFAVECFIYDANGKCIKKVPYTSKILDFETYAKDTLDFTEAQIEELRGKAVRVAYEKFHKDKKADRIDVEWYANKEDDKFDISAQVLLDENDDGVVNLADAHEDNDDYYGTAYVNGEASQKIVIDGDVNLTATEKPGYKFVGWYDETGRCFNTNPNATYTCARHTKYYAVFAPLGHGVLRVTHNKFVGDSIIKANGGSALYSVKIEDLAGNLLASGTTSAEYQATENEIYRITIGTDPLYMDTFYRWYTDAFAANGDKYFEEVGVNSADNLYKDNPSNYYDGTISDEVFFTFEYKFVGNDSKTINLYSDVKAYTKDVTIVYKYADRYNKTRIYEVPYTMSSEELANRRINPAKIIEFAPYIGDLYKNAMWTLSDDSYVDNTAYTYWAVQSDKTYDVSITVNGKTTNKNDFKFNDLVELDAKKEYNDTSISNKGMWVEVETRKVVAYGSYYSFRVTKDINLEYVADAQLGYNVLVDAPVYGREQDTSLNKDSVYIDYVASMLVPHFRGDTDENGVTFDKVYFENNEIASVDSPVTIETLEKYDYEVDYGILLEQVASCNEKTYNYDFDKMLQDAQGKGYGSPTHDVYLRTMLEKYHSDPLRKEKLGTDNSTGSLKAYYAYTGKAIDITNKNRILMTFEFDNTESYRQRFYNVYGYLMIKDTMGNVQYYFSEPQTLNIYVAGTSRVVEDKNTFD